MKTFAPIYQSCIFVVFLEWLEFSPYEAGFAKYGTFMKTELFGSKFYFGRVLKKFEEPDLRYLQGK